MTVHLQYKGGANWRVKKPSFISISKAPGALFRKNMVIQEKEREDIRKQERKRRFWTFSSTTFLSIKSPEENG